MAKHRLIVIAVVLMAVLLGSRPLAALSIDGFTEPSHKVDIAPAEIGTISNLMVHEGDLVEKGQVVAMLDHDVLVVSLKIAQASMEARGRLESAIAERDLRKNRLGKLQELRERGHASQEELDRAQSDLAIAGANVLVAEEQLALNRLETKKTEAMIERRTLRSPINGVVTKIYREEGEFVAPTAATVLTVVELDPLRVTFCIPTAQAVRMKIGQLVNVSFSDRESPAPGRIEFVAPVTDAESGTVRVKVLLDNPDGTLRCGVRCSLEIEGADAAPPTPRS